MYSIDSISLFSFEKAHEVTFVGHCSPWFLNNLQLLVSVSATDTSIFFFLLISLIIPTMSIYN